MQTALFLPFATITSCGDNPVATTATFIDSADDWPLAAFSMAITLPCLLWPLARDRAVGEAVRAFVAAGVFTVTGMLFFWAALFNADASPRVGFWALTGGSLALSIRCLWVALKATRHEPGRADPVMIALILGPVGLVAAATRQPEPEPQGVVDLLAAIALGMLVLPVLSLGVAIGRRDSMSPRPLWSRIALLVVIGLGWLWLGQWSQLPALLRATCWLGATTAFARAIWRPRRVHRLSDQI